MSKVILGIILAVGGPALVQIGFSDACSNELVGKLAPVLASLPGAALAWWARVRMGGVGRLGFRK